jgi:hypothetical protein
LRNIFRDNLFAIGSLEDQLARILREQIHSKTRTAATLLILRFYRVAAAAVCIRLIGDVTATATVFDGLHYVRMRRQRNREDRA